MTKSAASSEKGEKGKGKSNGMKDGKEQSKSQMPSEEKQTKVPKAATKPAKNNGKRK
ncbi:MAG: hypothetical protein HY276_06120 [Ignavibacteriales bacterium]|nr:hypothetical protein [Ignavibacteriales bacterium]